jgi:hypothetical protein
MEMYKELILMATLGQFIHICAKALSLKQKAKIGNASFSFWKFLIDDSLRIAITFAFVTILLYNTKEAVSLYPKLEILMKVVFAAVGYAGSDLVLRVGGKTSRAIDKVIDIKTNIADGIK